MKKQYSTGHTKASFKFYNKTDVITNKKTHLCVCQISEM